ncbi:MAG: hypothetical protein DI603_17650 [Roseateles depolymerans]|uniref:Uncharacterized protein n=1 Tax=Roseateles depolymerans TaxID=76731 RepID=A0A2W5DB14_9BURK|nr:MAG: hypothetical protein DI603_17650 [Roseateles depolymerans]
MELTCNASEHLEALKTVLAYFGAPPGGAFDRERAGVFVQASRRMRACAKARMPCGDDPQDLILAFLQARWDCRTPSVWRRYKRARLLQPEMPLHVPVSKGPLLAWAEDGRVEMLPLEAAIACGHLYLYGELLRCGASIDRVPSRAWFETRRPLTVFGFIRKALPCKALICEFRALTAQAMGAHPLELAVFGQDVVYFQELLAYGKRIRSIPSRNWDVGRRGTPDARTLIRSLISDSTLRAGFLDLMERASRGEKIPNDF